MNSLPVLSPWLVVIFGWCFACADGGALKDACMKLIRSACADVIYWKQVNRAETTERVRRLSSKLRAVGLGLLQGFGPSARARARMARIGLRPPSPRTRSQEPTGAKQARVPNPKPNSQTKETSWTPNFRSAYLRCRATVYAHTEPPTLDDVRWTCIRSD